MMTADEFRTQLARLVDTPLATQVGAGVEVSDSVLCIGTVFSKSCERCYYARYATDCSDCTHITHCTDCRHCHRSAFCYKSEHCRESSYLAFCTNMTECDYCFGCVGLVGKDFHILNKPYSRAEYFSTLKKMTQALGITLP